MASDDESDLEVEKTAKQAYLTEEVLEQGYDSRVFMEFISTYKEPDINLWSLDELKKVVEAFKSKHSTVDVPTSVPAEPSEPIKSDVATAPPVENNPVQVPTEEVKHETNCIKSKACEKNQLTGCADLRVKVSEPQVTGGGLFSKKYVVYTITTEPLGWIVKRRYSQFLKLREVLTATYLGSYLPPIPSKKAQGNLEDETVFKRQVFLNQFLVVLLKDQLIRGSPHLLNFLMESDELKHKRYLSSIKAKKPEKVDQTINIDGEGMLELTDCTQIYDQQMNYLNQNETIKKKFETKCMQLMEDDKRLSESLKKYADILKELQEVQNKIPNNEEHSCILNQLYESMNNWSIHELDNVKNINQYIKIPFSYSHKQTTVLKEMLKEREAVYSNYKKLEAKHKPDKPRDALDRSKELYGYYNYKTQREVERVIKDETALSLLHFSDTAKKQGESITEFHKIWGDLLSKLSEMKFDMDNN
jgi:PX domain